MPLLRVISAVVCALVSKKADLVVDRSDLRTSVIRAERVFRKDKRLLVPFASNRIFGRDTFALQISTAN